MKHPISTSLTLLAIGFLVWIFFLGPGFQWTGAVVKPFTVRVTQQMDKRPLSNATVLFLRNTSEAQRFTTLNTTERSDFLDHLIRAKMAGETGADGKVSLCGQFGAGGTSSLLWDRGCYHASGTLLIQQTDGSWSPHVLEGLVEKTELRLGEQIPLIEITLP